MQHSYSNLLTHIVYSTKGRKTFIDDALEARLFPYFGGILRQLGGKLYVVNGAQEHVHMLAEFPPSIGIAEAVGKIKGSSSYWIHQSFPDRSGFAWQRGYAAFSVSKSPRWPDISNGRRRIIGSTRSRRSLWNSCGDMGLRWMGFRLSPAEAGWNDWADRFPPAEAGGHGSYAGFAGDTARASSRRSVKNSVSDNADLR